MNAFFQLSGRKASLALLLLLLPALAGAQQRGSLRGQVYDQTGAVIPDAVVTLVLPGGAERTARSSAVGAYVFDGLPPGEYTLKAGAPGFAPFEQAGVRVAAGRATPLNITLKVAMERQKVEVSAEPPVSVDPESNASAVVLKGRDLETLPDDPDDLAQVLQAMAGPSAGPNGGQFFIDGFTGTNLPSKESIREIRINQNPFSAEYDHMGFGRIEIFTRPGMDKLHGGLMFHFNNQDLNTRNPFASNKAPHELRMLNGTLTGPLSAKRASFFLSFHRREIDDNAVIHARTLDSGLNVLDISQAVVTPTRNTEISPRVDLKLNDKNTLVLSYEYERSSAENAGVGDLSLASRAFSRSNFQHTLRLTETAVLNTKTVNETRFQFLRPVVDLNGDNSIPSINVLGSFVGGGSQVGRSSTQTNRWELQNYTTRASGRHTIKFGGRLRWIGQDDFSANNFGGTYTFSGGFGPELDGANQPIAGTRIALTSLDRHRRTLLFLGMGLPPDEVRRRGGGASQFSLTGGNPEAQVSQLDFGGFVQDDWRLRSNLTLSGGLRYETQNNIHNPLNLAPRVAFAWSPRVGKSGPPKTVIRGGFGMFYDRFSEGLTLQARRFDGVRQQQFIVDERTDPTPLNFFPRVPSLANLAAFAVPLTVRQVAGDVRSPYTITGAVSLERQLPKNFTLSTTYIRTRGLHTLRSRNINAPLSGTITAVNPNGIRPLGNVGNIYEYESGGIYNQHQLVVGVFNRMSRNFTLFANYMLGRARGDTDGAGTFPADSYDLRGEYGRSSFDVRQRAFLGGSLNLPRGFTLNPFVTLRSGLPFNITTGQDINGDSQYNERPAFATDLTRPSAVVTPWGAFDRSPLPAAALIPRNYGQGPGFVSVNLRLNKTVGFGLREEARRARQSRSAGGAAGAGREGRAGGGGPMMHGGGPIMVGGGGGGGGGMRGGGPGMFVMGGGGSSDYRYNVTFSISAQNLFNHTNPANPVGNLSSPLFGQSLGTAGGFGFVGPGGGGGSSAAGNRKVELQLRFNF